MVSCIDYSDNNDCSINKMSDISGSSISCYQDEEFTVTRIVDTVGTSSANSSDVAAYTLEVREQMMSEPLSATPIKRMYSESGQKIILNPRDDFGEKFETIFDFTGTRTPMVQKKQILNPEESDDDQLFWTLNVRIFSQELNVEVYV